MFNNLNLKTEIIYITKITKILKKGKKLRFKILVITGNYKNIIGFGIGKDIKFENARKKAIENSYKNLIYIKHFKINNKNTVPFSILLKLKKNSLISKPNYYNTGVRSNKLFYVLSKMSGFNNLLIKKQGPKNIINNTMLFFNFLNYLNTLNKNNFKFYKQKFNNKVKNLKEESKKKIFIKIKQKLRNYKIKNISFVLKNFNIKDIIKFL